MFSKRWKFALSITMLLLILIVAFIGLGLFISKNTADCNKMEPLDAGDTSHAKYLDFSEKTRIGWRMFGFKKEITVKESSVVLLEVGGSTKYGYFGIYRDENLQQAIEEIPFTWEYRNGGYEEGLAEYIPNEEGKDGIVVLQPGTYYIAVFTKNPFDIGEVSYLSHICALNENCRLVEGKRVFFCSINKKKPKNIFEIKEKRSGRIIVTEDIYWNGTIKVYDEDHKIIFRREKRDYVESEIPEAVFDIVAEKSYYIEVSQIELPDDSRDVRFFSIKYDFLLIL